jgi:phage tail-like protein
VGEHSAALQAVFTEVSGLQVEMQVTEYEEGGTNNFVHRLPGRLKVGNVTLKHGMTVSNAFLKWCMKTSIGSLHRQNVTVVMYDVAGQPVVRWHFNNAYPVKWTGPQFTADSTAMAIESVEFTHEGLTVDPA